MHIPVLLVIIIDTLLLLLGRIAALAMQPISTDGVVWSVCVSVCLSVCLSVCHNRAPCKNGPRDRDAVWDIDSGEPKEPCIRCGSRSPHVKWQFEG